MTSPSVAAAAGLILLALLTGEVSSDTAYVGSFSGSFSSTGSRTGIRRVAVSLRPRTALKGPRCAILDDDAEGVQPV